MTSIYISTVEVEGDPPLIGGKVSHDFERAHAIIKLRWEVGAPFTELELLTSQRRSGVTHYPRALLGRGNYYSNAFDRRHEW